MRYDPERTQDRPKPTGHWLKEAFTDGMDAWPELLGANVLWLLLTLLVIPAPPAVAGLFYQTNALSHGQAEGWSGFLAGFRKYFWLSYGWALLNLLALALIVSNLWFYAQFQAGWATLVQGAFLMIGLFWIGMQVFVFPLILEQTDPRLWTALRNSLVLWIRKPGFCAGFFLLLVVAGVVSLIVIVPALLLTSALGAFLINRALLHLLEEIPKGTG